jgi:hypothetical protein
MIDRELEKAVLSAFEDALNRSGATHGGAPANLSNGIRMNGLASEIDRAINVSRTANTPAASTESSTRAEGRTGRSLAAAVLKTGLGAAPLAHLVARLFGGGDPEPPPPLTKYAFPAPIRIARANRSPVDGHLSFAEFDYGQDGAQRAFNQERAHAADPVLRVISADQKSAENGAARPPQITVNVQAMDSKSFLDHSDEIARAVREAMLNMHSLNDVISEL